ncbi:uncharacterized protein LOC119985518 [Tripterygium wilfordii]|uniref:uncharacterized protein LOC119985518 n=1 Tax=Tripterygium wilfordii TaxID=458696 RepID=UPI0018F8221D|nr:uncharacterized protein LOC119985518 [Tripterygium wilfordii]
MPFGPKNADAMYQRAMNAIFHDMIGYFLLVYIDDIVVKSRKAEDHIKHLRKSLERMRMHQLKLNPLKYAFGVNVGNFLGFLVHQRGIEVDQNKAKAVMEVKVPTSKKKLQYISRFSRLFVGQYNLNGQEQAIYYLSISLIDTEIRKGRQMKAVKGQALVDFLTDHHTIEVSDEEAAKAGIVIKSPRGTKSTFSFILDFDYTNNQAEYEALLIKLEILKELGAQEICVLRDSQLVLKQLIGEYKCNNLAIAPYYVTAVQLLVEFEEVTLNHLSREDNWKANELAHTASGLWMSADLTHKIILVDKRLHPSIRERGMSIEVLNVHDLATDLRQPIMEYLKNPNLETPRNVKVQAQSYVLIEGEC